MNRKKWAETQTKDFVKKIELLNKNLNLNLSPFDYVESYIICITKYYLSYPSEYKLADIISNEDDKEIVLDVTKAMMKDYRIKYQNTQKTNKKPAFAGCISNAIDVL